MSAGAMLADILQQLTIDAVAEPAAETVPANNSWYRFGFRPNPAVPMVLPTAATMVDHRFKHQRLQPAMATTLLELVRARRAELEAAQPGSGISDETRIWAIMSLSAKAAEGDPDARARLKAVEQLFARSNRPQKS
jgi:hypothetical protein